MSAYDSDIGAPLTPSSAGRTAGVLLGCLAGIGIAASGANFLIVRIWPTAIDSVGRMTGTSALIATLLLHTGVVVGASYAAAAFAPNRPRGHALALGLILVGFIILFPVLRLAGEDMATSWYHFADLLFTLPAARLGAALFERTLARHASRALLFDPPGA